VVFYGQEEMVLKEESQPSEKVTNYWTFVTNKVKQNKFWTVVTYKVKQNKN
jgi:hypothetical protein